GSGISSGFLPAICQGTPCRTEGAPIQNLTPPGDGSCQRMLLDQINQWNDRYYAGRPDDSRLAARLSNYELAFRMQTAAPELIDISREPQGIRDLYGVEKENTSKFGRMCLLARRMVERGVRFVQLYNSDWDGQGECAKNHKENAEKIDQPINALISALNKCGRM